MSRTTSFALLPVALAFAAFPIGKARAAEEDTQFWTILTLEGSPAEDVSASFEINPRLRSDAAGGELVQTRVAVDYRIAPSISVGGGALYSEFAGGHEFRPHQQVTFSTGRLSFRTRLAQRFFNDADRMELRIRQRVQTVQALGEGTSVAASGELYYILRSRRPERDAHVDQWRANLTLRRSIDAGLTGSLGYLLILVPVPNQTNRVSHVAQLGLTLRL